MPSGGGQGRWLLLSGDSVQVNNLELQQVSARGNRLLPLTRVRTAVRGLRRAGGPGPEILLGGPGGDDEVAVVTLGRAEQLEALEAGGGVDGVGTGGEALLELGAGTDGKRKLR